MMKITVFIVGKKFSQIKKLPVSCNRHFFSKTKIFIASAVVLTLKISKKNTDPEELVTTAFQHSFCCFVSVNWEATVGGCLAVIPDSVVVDEMTARETR